MTQPKSRGFTLVELLVVITIIGILAALITVAAVGALKHARQAEIKSDINEIDAAFQALHNKYGEYPPNCLADRGVDVVQEFKNLKHYLRGVAPRNREPDALLLALVDTYQDIVNFPRTLHRGISASEAVVFWLGGFSPDPNYPISGEGGPSYAIAKFGDPDNRKLDPISSRKWSFGFDVSRLGPRATDGYFDEVPVTSAGSKRCLEYCIKGKWRRINFWHYTARKSEEPFLYFDVSHGSPTIGNDVPSTPWNYLGPQVYPLKWVDERDAQGAPLTFKFVNEGKFQILHAGPDDAWGNVITHFYEYNHVPGCDYPGPDNQNFMRLDIDANGKVTPEERAGMIFYPDGPWVDDLGDTIVNFTTEMKVEDARQ